MSICPLLRKRLLLPPQAICVARSRKKMLYTKITVFNDWHSWQSPLLTKNIIIDHSSFTFWILWMKHAKIRRKKNLFSILVNRMRTAIQIQRRKKNISWWKNNGLSGTVTTKIAEKPVNRKFILIWLVWIGLCWLFIYLIENNSWLNDNPMLVILRAFDDQLLMMHN